MPVREVGAVDCARRLPRPRGLSRPLWKARTDFSEFAASGCGNPLEKVATPRTMWQEWRPRGATPLPDRRIRLAPRLRRHDKGPAHPGPLPCGESAPQLLLAARARVSGCGTMRMYGFGSSQLPKSSFASSLETEPAMITSSP